MSEWNAIKKWVGEYLRLKREQRAANSVPPVPALTHDEIGDLRLALRDLQNAAERLDKPVYDRFWRFAEGRSGLGSALARVEEAIDDFDSTTRPEQGEEPEPERPR